MRGVSKVAKTSTGDRPSVPISIYNPRDYAAELDFNSLPGSYREILEIAICGLLDRDSGKIILTGSERSGKTFFGAQIIYSAEKFLQNYGFGALIPLRITRTDYNELAGRVDSIGDYLQIVAQELGVDVSELCVFTDHTEVAGRIADSGIDAKIVLEAPEPMYEAMMKAQGSGMTSVWSGWDVFDVGSLYLRRRDLVEMVFAAQHDRLLETHAVELKKKDTLAIVNHLLNICGAMRVADGDDKNPYLVSSPSHVAILVRRFIQVISSMAPEEITRDEINRAIERTFEQHRALLEEMHRKAHEIRSEEGGSTVTIAASTPEEARAAMEAMGFELTEKMEEDLFSGFARERAEEKEKVSSFRGKFRSISSLEKSLKKSIIGQDRAIGKVVDALSIPAAGMHSAKKPLRTMLFLGPTGVGKTELSLQLAENLYTDPLNVIRLDMSEFSTEGATTSLFGSTPGYIGYSEDGGMLTREVAKHPHSLIILDEIEKAKPSTWDAFLQILDAGRMTTGSGKVVDFSNCVIVMTSNLGTEEMSARGIGFGDSGSSIKSPEELERIAKSALKKYFRIEFLNRIDEIVVFDQLGPDSARRIVEKELKDVSKLIEGRGHSLTRTTTDILDSILKSSDFDQFGAREIQRTIQRKVSVPLAKLVLDAGKSPKKFKLQKSDDSTLAVTEA